MKARRYVVSGRVQGVGYRYFVGKEAKRLGIRGYARNLADGTVEVVAVGEEQLVDELLAALQLGPRAAEVRGVHHEEAPLVEFVGFEIR